MMENMKKESTNGHQFPQLVSQVVPQVVPSFERWVPGLGEILKDEKMDILEQKTEGGKRLVKFGWFLLSLVGFLSVWSFLELLKTDTTVVKDDSTAAFFRVKLVPDNGISPTEEEDDDDVDMIVDFNSILGNAVNYTGHRLGLPRTSKREYNLIEPGKKYFIYSNSGGFSNQLLCFLSAIFVARMANRTLLVPPIGRHSNLYTGYLRLGIDEVLPADQALDFEYIEQMTGVELLPLNITLKDFHETVLGGSTRHTEILHFERIKADGGLRHAPHVYNDKFVKKISKSKKKFAYGFGRFYGKYLAGKSRAQGYMRFSPYLREFSRVIAKEALGGRYNAFHIRMGDYSHSAMKYSSDSKRFASVAKGIGFSRETPVYLASESLPTKQYFKPIIRYWSKVVHASQLGEYPEVRRWVEDFNARLPQTEIRSSIFGLVDQLLCARAEKFVGTSISTFTQRIVYHRKYIQTILPDVVEESEPTYDMSKRKYATTLWG